MLWIRGAVPAPASAYQDPTTVPLTDQTPSPLSNGDALSLLLSAEGFLLAAVALAVTLGAPNQTLQLKYTFLKPYRIMNASVALIALLAIGSVGAWFGLCDEGSFDDVHGKFVGASLMLAIIGMPAVAYALVLGSRRS